MSSAPTPEQIKQQAQRMRAKAQGLALFGQEDCVLAEVALRYGATMLESLATQLAEAQRKIKGYQLECNEVEQVLGKALGYPWFKDDQKNFPGSTNEHGVCVGEHVPSSIAAEAANQLSTLRDAADRRWETALKEVKMKVSAAIYAAAPDQISDEIERFASRAIDELKLTPPPASLSPEKDRNMVKKKFILLTDHEVQSGLDRVRHAERLIRQLPEIHEGRNTWLLWYGGDKNVLHDATAPQSATEPQEPKS